MHCLFVLLFVLKYSINEAKFPSHISSRDRIEVRTT